LRLGLGRRRRPLVLGLGRRGAVLGSALRRRWGRRPVLRLLRRIVLGLGRPSRDHYGAGLNLDR
jgi:hypothetical protein